MSELTAAAIYSSYTAMKTAAPDFDPSGQYEHESVPALAQIIGNLHEQHGNAGVTYFVHALAMAALDGMVAEASKRGMSLEALLEYLERRVMTTEKRLRDEGEQ